ncbi:MAG: hypothetical protein J0H83_09495 [Candidatus Melainabacteria bacterium]|nr:hypothetical protein [Candidatus Melainabacteria bacterium]
MPCAFCENDNPLCDSHIIPLGIWRLKDTGSGFLEVSTDSHLKPKRINKGWYQKLLCADCEGFFGREFDEYGRNFFAGAGVWKPITLGPGATYFDLAGADASKLKLFVLSVLWRASVAPDEPFSEFKLLPEQERKLASMLLCRQPGETFDFATAIFKYADDGRNLHKIAVAPRLFRDSGCVRYAEIHLNEFACRINVSNQKDKARFDPFWLTASEPVRIMQTSAEKKIAFGVRALADQYKRFSAFRASHAKP